MCRCEPPYLTLHTVVSHGRTSDGYALHDGIVDVSLAALRRDLRGLQAEFAAWQTAALAELRGLGVGAAHQAEFLVVRDAQAVLEHDDVRRRIRVVRETPDFVVCTVRYDDTALALLKREQAVACELEEAEAIILDAFAERIALCTAALERAAHWVAALDIMLARRAFVVRYDLQRATMHARPRFLCTDAAYLPLREQLGQRYTPLSLCFDTVAVLSGANMGG